MRGDRNVAAYVEARDALDRLQVQLDADPTRRDNGIFMAHYTEARRASTVAFRTLTGGQLGRAQRLLAQRQEVAASRRAGIDEDKASVPTTPQQSEETA
jgi:hypothetical protein